MLFDIFDIIFRTVIMYFYILIILRVTGKREIGQLSPFDFVIAIIIAEIATIPIENLDVPLWHGLLPITILGLLEFGFAWLILINRKVRLLIYGKPQTIIKNGKVLCDEMKKARYNLDDLMSQLREKDIFNIQDVEFGVLECSGKLSVLPKSQKRGVTPEDLGLSTKYEGLPTALVMDGEIMKKNLQQANLDEKWLRARLKENGLTPGKVLIATLSTDGKLFINECNPK
ncbi:MAG: DUF421 domain-containing protein [Clostridiales bacterium]|nr:DUF421 domain-containing protein [Clostridiales bacterium]